MISFLNRNKFIQIDFKRFEISYKIIYDLQQLLFNKIILLNDDESFVLRIFHEIK